MDNGCQLQSERHRSGRTLPDKLSLLRDHPLFRELAIARVFSTKNSAAGLKVRFFNVQMPTGYRTPRFTGRILRPQRLWPLEVRGIIANEHRIGRRANKD